MAKATPSKAAAITFVCQVALHRLENEMSQIVGSLLAASYFVPPIASCQLSPGPDTGHGGETGPPSNPGQPLAGRL